MIGDNNYYFMQESQFQKMSARGGNSEATKYVSIQSTSKAMAFQSFFFALLPQQARDEDGEDVAFAV
jgi:hypothetical protein